MISISIGIVRSMLFGLDGVTALKVHIIERWGLTVLRACLRKGRLPAGIFEQ
jgi:hypothetical protein